MKFSFTFDGSGVAVRIKRRQSLAPQQADLSSQATGVSDVDTSSTPADDTASGDVLVSFVASRKMMWCTLVLFAALLVLNWLWVRAGVARSGGDSCSGELGGGIRLLYGLAASVMWLRTLLFVFFQAKKQNVHPSLKVF
jgi:hypothetical protein